ncbi:MAG: pseudouridine synthase [Flavobacteriales bacterium]|jgi:23S rRNA pseudouridine2605 synthase|uniref:pseudouridine synthase n=1 Tax=Candidatus Ulvibacter alkanivorans TaxID=2267620 RepID=UPI000DF45EE1|nr:S4 domain-containing protein [Candidatus Ulvibacter alkanivorans]MCH2489251.1 pseudouridine synthase [Flavobacteriales bacterium]
MSRQDKSSKGKASGRGGNNTKKRSSARGNAPFKKENTNKQSGRQNKMSGKSTASKNSSEGGIRLNKYISNSGICSRREADTYIATGLVSVNGKIINEMGYKVQLSDDVRFDGRRINPEPNVYVLLNKPKGFATTTSESKGQTVMDLIANATSVRVTPIGRLGRNATGLLFFTNDDKLKEKLSKKGMERLFHVELDKNLKADDLQKISEGLSVDGKTIEVEEISYVDNAPKKEVGLKIKHMGNSVIRTIFDHLGYNVVRVDCVTIAHLTKKDLPRGRWKILTQKEVELFSML